MLTTNGSRISNPKTKLRFISFFSVGVDDAFAVFANVCSKFVFWSGRSRCGVQV